MSKIRVLCVDDHLLMREGVVRVLGLHRDVTVVAQAGDGQEAIDQFVKHRPDVTLMDLQLPGVSGVQAIAAIRQLDANARIIVLTMYQADEDVYGALQAGAAGYLIKDTVPENLIRVIREVHEGKRSIPPDIQAKFDVRMGQRVLTARELQVLELLGQGMRNKEVAIELHISEDTTRAHIKNIFLKLNVRDRTAALSEGLKRGLIRIG